MLNRLTAFIEPGLDTIYATHGLHPYPAKFIPHIPAEIIAEHTNERHVIFDPFCGSGTTLLEALLGGRRSVGCDSNPIATLISRAKSTPIRQTARDEAAAFLEAVARVKNRGHVPRCPTPTDPRLHAWFQAHVIQELAFLSREIAKISDSALKQLAQCVLSSIIVSVSNQESETRYAAVEKVILSGETITKFSQKLGKALISLNRIDEACKHEYLIPKVIHADLRKLGPGALPDNSVDLVVTSPPYANSFDYYLYHKWRMIWLGFDHSEARDIEIGSRYEHSSKRAPIAVFEKKMAEALSTVERVLKPSKLAYFLVGDSVIAGTLINAEESLQRIASTTGLKFVDAISYPLGQVSRSFREKVSEQCHGGTKHVEKQQRILVFESTNSGNTSSIRASKSSRPTARYDHVELRGILPNGAQIALKSQDVARHVHSLARYPSKFVPAVPRWAISTFSAPGDIIYDPFAGSGTTSVEALILGRSAIASDISPFACLATRAKTTRVPNALIKKETAKFLAWIDGKDRALTEGARFPLDSFWFDLNHLDEFAGLKRFVDRSIHKSLNDFFNLCLAQAIRKFSYQDEGQIKVKRDPKKVASGTSSPITIIKSQLSRNVERLCEFMMQVPEAAHSEVHQISADNLVSFQHRPNLIVTSPPYINAMNYPMTHRYENFLLGLVKPEENNNHEREYIGTERVRSSDYRMLRRVPPHWRSATSINETLARIHALEPKRSYIAYSFFMRMDSAIKQWSERLAPDGKIVLVCGRNRIRGVSVDTFGILSELLVDAGFRTITSFEYEIVKQSLRLTRHETADLITFDGVLVAERS